ncbi:PadR family transcriptional regulator [Actinomadura gamaensis]|uniref:PadR family transcriptional regulator n=1 Tax=Actinomadura gamaensis TaxID=1763541 RepID=A0ABV9U1Y0_9ACTN
MAVRSSPLALTVLALLHYRPLHPYGMQRLIKDWGKDQVVNVGQRTSLYRTIDRLTEAGLVRVRATERDQAYPERTVYEITDEGRATARTWLDDMLATPRRDFPEFPAALSHLLMIAPREALSALERRAARVAATLADHDEVLAANARDGHGRVAGIETEYARTMAAAEHAWLLAVIDDLRSGALTWEGAT